MVYLLVAVLVLTAANLALQIYESRRLLSGVLSEIRKELHLSRVGVEEVYQEVGNAGQPTEVYEQPWHLSEEQTSEMLSMLSECQQRPGDFARELDLNDGGAIEKQLEQWEEEGWVQSNGSGWYEMVEEGEEES